MQKEKLESDKPLVSVIIPTYNSSETLEYCLSSLKNQTYPPTEILIIDNFSKDATIEIARNFGAIIFLLRSNLPRARNFGLAHASGKYILHLDSDMTLTATVIEECVKTCEENNFDAVSINEVSFEKGFWGKCISLEKSLNSGDVGVITPRFFKKIVLNTLGGSDETLEAGEDWDLWVRMNKRGYNVKFINTYLVHHEATTLKKFLRRKYRWAKTIHKYLSKHPSNALRQWAPIKPHNLWCNRKEIFRKPQYFIGMIFLKFIRLFVGFMGIILRE